MSSLRRHSELCGGACQCVRATLGGEPYADVSCLSLSLTRKRCQVGPATMNKEDDDDVEDAGPAKQLTKEEASMQSVVGDGAKAVTLQVDTKGFAFLEAAVRKRKAELQGPRKAAENVAVVRNRACVLPLMHAMLIWGRASQLDEDVATVARELDMEPRQAREYLQLHGGDVAKAFQAYVDAHRARAAQ